MTDPNHGEYENGVRLGAVFTILSLAPIGDSGSDVECVA